MKIHLSVHHGGSNSDVTFDIAEGAVVGHLSRALAGDDEDMGAGLNGRTLAIEGRGPLPIDANVLVTGLRSGQHVMVVDPVGPSGTRPERSATGSTPRLNETEGSQLILLDAAAQPASVFAVRSGAIVGRGSAADIRIEDPTVSRRHFELFVDEAGARIHDLGSTYGTTMDGVVVKSTTAICDGALIRAGDVQLIFRVAGGPGPVAEVEGPIQYFNRPPRTEPRYEGKQFTAPHPPDRPEPEPFAWALAAMPVFMAGVLWALTKNIASIAFALLSPAMIAAAWWQSRGTAQKRYARLLDRYRQDVSALELDVAEEQTTETAARRVQAPDTASVIREAVAKTPGLWIRGVDDPDFLLVRIGQGDQPSVVSIEIPDGGEPEERAAIETLPTRYGTVVDVPVEVDLRTGGVGFAGPTNERDDVVRSVIAQITALHSPAEVAVAALLSPEAAARWEWLKWLPHTRFPLSALEGEHLSASPAAWADLLRRLALLCGRRMADRRSATDAAHPSWVVVIVDDHARVDRPTLDALLRSGPMNGVTFLWIADREQDLPRLCHSVVTVDPVDPVLGFSVAGSGRSQSGIRADFLGPAEADSFARGLAPVQDLSARTASELDLPAVVLLSELLGGATMLDDEHQLQALWRANMAEAKTLRTPVGQAAGSDFTIDIVAEGPHGFLIGTTGSGKSELLRTYLVSLAASYPPERVNFLLIDFKGGAALKPFLEVPHTVGLVTNLREGESSAEEKLESKVRRTIVWLRAELQRRMGIFDRHGFSDIADMEKKHAAETPPRLLIVADEFAVLKSSNSTGDDVIDEIVNIARLGRSLGIHLLLATQKAAGVITDNIRANTNLRIALRVQQSDESMDVLGVRDAADISIANPGRAFVTIGGGNLSRIQTASSTGHTSALQNLPKVRCEPFTFVGRTPVIEAPPQLPIGTGPNDLSLLTATIARAAATWPTPQPDHHWVEAPASVVSLMDLPLPADEFALDLGLLDDPSSQMVRPAVVNLRASGHLLVWGTSRSGKTVLLRSAAASLARRLGPDDLRIIGIDAAGRGLAPLAALPQVAGIVASDDVEMVYRVMRELRETVARRVDAFAVLKVADLAEYRAAHPLGPDRQLVLVLLDGLAGFGEKYGALDLGIVLDRLGSLLLDGPPVGVHFVMSSNRRAGLPIGLLSAIEETIVLRMASLDEYGNLDIAKRDIPIEPPPGRGRFRRFDFQGAMVVGAADWAGLEVARRAHNDDAYDALVLRATAGEAQVEAFSALGQALGQRWAARAAPLRRLNELVAAEEVVADLRPWQACIGMTDGSFSAARVDLEQAHFIVTGPPRSGKSNAIGALAVSLMASTPRLETYLATTRPSTITHLRWTRSAIGEAPVAEVLAFLEARVDAGDDTPTLVCVDDVGDLEDAWQFSKLVASANRGARMRFIVSGDARAIHFGPNEGVQAIRRFRCGLLLQPDVENDGDVVGARLPRQLWRQFPAGRGYLVHGPDVSLVQVTSVGSAPQ